MWIFMIIAFLAWAGAPRELTTYNKSIKDPVTKTWTANTKVVHTPTLIKPSSVFVSWTMTGIFASALIYTLRTRKPIQAG